MTAIESETMVTPGYSIGGSIHLDLVVTRVASEETETTMNADIVFDDTGLTAGLTLDVDFTYRIDLTTGLLAR
jgi:hypothetical protein